MTKQIRDYVLEARQIREAKEQKNEKNYSFSKEQLIKAATILKTIATNSSKLPMSDGAILLKASTILTNNLNSFIAGESIISEAVTSKGLSYMTSKLPKEYKIGDLRKYGQITSDEQLKAAVDKELVLIVKQRQKFIDDALNSLKKDGITSVTARRLNDDTFEIKTRKYTKKLKFVDGVYYDYKNDKHKSKAEIQDWGKFETPEKLAETLKIMS